MLLGDAEGPREERIEHMVTVEHRRSIGVALFGKRDVAVVRLVGQALLLQGRHGLVDRRFGHAELRRDVDRTDRRLRRTAQHDDGLEIIFVRHGHFFHRNPPLRLAHGTTPLAPSERAASAPPPVVPERCTPGGRKRRGRSHSKRWAAKFDSLPQENADPRERRRRR